MIDIPVRSTGIAKYSVVPTCIFRIAAPVVPQKAEPKVVLQLLSMSYYPSVIQSPRMGIVEHARSTGRLEMPSKVVAGDCRHFPEWLKEMCKQGVCRPRRPYSSEDRGIEIFAISDHITIVFPRF